MKMTEPLLNGPAYQACCPAHGQDYGDYLRETGYALKRLGIQWEQM